MGLIRILLALAVIITHTNSIFGLHLISGGLAVEAFFITSGFYMALILAEKYDTAQQGGYTLFLTNRLTKLLPAYWATCLLLIALSLCGYFFLGDPFLLRPYFSSFDTLSPLALGLFIVSNLTLLFQDLIMFLGIDAETGMLYFIKDLPSTPLNEVAYPFLLVRPAWSISLELMFYLIVPFLVKRSYRWLALLIGLSLLVRLVLAAHGYSQDPWSYRFFPSELVFFLLGIVGYRIYKAITPWFSATASRRQWLWGAYAICILSIFGYPLLPFDSEVKDAAFLLLFFLCLPFIFLLSKRWKKDRYLGELSYPLYISHMLSLVVAGKLLSELGLPREWTGELCLALSLLFSLLLQAYLLQPIDRYRQRRVTAQQ